MAELQEIDGYKLMYLTPDDYKEYVFVGAACGQPLLEMFPKQMFVLFEGGSVIADVAGGFTKQMEELGFEDSSAIVPKEGYESFARMKGDEVTDIQDGSGIAYPPLSPYSTDSSYWTDKRVQEAYKRAIERMHIKG